MITFLGPGERVEADDGYIGEAPHNIKCPMSVTNPREMMKIQGRLRSRQETVNGRFKDWGVLKKMFRHYASDYENILHAIVVLTQMAIYNCEIVFAVNIVMFDFFRLCLSFLFTILSLSVPSGGPSFDGSL